ncbi:helix-turn-helix domain-containing protein [Burkholderia pyrrocinia]|uniref:helix-turn-helix domain-containing protein n=1 Tax=Burkholderia pyrrocinia TaxID=60550 RepID=UPI001BCE5F18|nr:helix-turn-helix transcriptional regulator [Burkholderia pyrrocinia]QVN19387.1 helix-turn-helix transcriptional regulator [Burkholderia pyrrocinia]
MDDFPIRLKQERKRMRLTQPEFAALGGVHKQAQFHYERGTRRPNSDYLVGLASAGVDVYYLLTGQVATLASTVEEQQILSRYRALDADQRIAMLALMDTMGVSTHRAKQNGDS